MPSIKKKTQPGLAHSELQTNASILIHFNIRWISILEVITVFSLQPEQLAAVWSSWSRLCGPLTARVQIPHSPQPTSVAH